MVSTWNNTHLVAQMLILANPLELLVQVCSVHVSIRASVDHIISFLIRVLVQVRVGPKKSSRRSSETDTN